MLFSIKKFNQWHRQISGTCSCSCSCSNRPPKVSVLQLLYFLTTCLVLQLLKLWLLQKTQKRTPVTLNQQMQEMEWLLLSLVVQPKYISTNRQITCKNTDQLRYQWIIAIFDNLATVQSRGCQISRVLLHVPPKHY